MTTGMFYFLILPLLVQGQVSFWGKYYITYSVENDFHHIELIKKAINEMDIQALEIDYVRPGEGDIKIYFTDNMQADVIGSAAPPETGEILINRQAVHANLSIVLQHEMAHALGLDHSNDNSSAMFHEYVPGASFLKTDKNNLNALYKCRFDSVTLLNDKTYLKFKGRHYERMDLNRASVFKSKLWHPSIFKVNAMYRNNTYFIIANNFTYFEYNHSMELIKEGHIRDLFPNINGIISAILTLNNGSIICFLQNRDILYDGVKIDSNTFRQLPSGVIQGAFATFNRIYLIVKDYIFTYDADLKYITEIRLCEHEKFKTIHCCNGYSNM